jgi:hypothetical protein
MANQGILEVSLLDVTGSAARDGKVKVTVRRAASTQVVRVFSTSFPPVRKFTLPAFPVEKVLTPFIEPSRYRATPMPPFTLTDGMTVTGNVRAFRQPSEWEPRFTKWENLPSRFKRLKTVLEQSPRLKVRGAGSFEFMTGATYDAATDDERVRLPKMSLLNLHAKLTELADPAGKQPWFGFVRQVLEIGRERLIAVVDARMASRIIAIRDDIESHKNTYKHAEAQHHHPNMPRAYGVLKKDMFSIKTTEDHGNVQLTVGKGTDPETGAEAWILDADIDENGQLLTHLGDLFKHRFTGGTHPIDIHEFLLMAHPGIDLGYLLR